MMDLLHTYSPDIEQISIDECFLDFTPILRLYESPIAAATQIKDDIRNRFHFTVNIGIAPNKLLAKMASDFKKPDHIHTLFFDEIPAKMWPLSVDDLYMVGHSSANRLKSFGIRTIGDLAHTDVDFLKREFKSHGVRMWEYANGIDHSVVDATEHELKCVGNSVTLREDVTAETEARRVLLSLSETVSERLRSGSQIAQSVTVEIKYSDFSSFSHQMPLFSPTNTTDTIYDAACHLFHELWNGKPVRLLGHPHRETAACGRAGADEHFRFRRYQKSGIRSCRFFFQCAKCCRTRQTLKASVPLWTRSATNTAVMPRARRFLN